MNSSQKLGGLRRANRIAAHYEHVSAVQALCMVLCCASGAALLILPSVVAGRFGTASWLLPFAGLAFSAATVLLIAAAYKKSGAPNVEALFDAAFGTHFGPFFCVLFRLYSIARTAVCVGVFACAVKGLMLPELPLKWILFDRLHHGVPRHARAADFPCPFERDRRRISRRGAFVYARLHPRRAHGISSAAVFADRARRGRSSAAHAFLRMRR